MNSLDLNDLNEFVNTHIVDFHKNRIRTLQDLKLEHLLKKKNPYLFKAKNITTASDLIDGLLSAFLSSSEEKLFGDFLEELAIFISSRTCNGHKSVARGIDLEFINSNIHYVVSIKSGPSWGNSSQQRKLEQDLKNAVSRLKQSNLNLNVQPVLGICYGKTKTSFIRGYLKVVGQNFWYLISGDERVYTDIVEPIGFRAKQHNEFFIEEKTRIINFFTQQFLSDFSMNGKIDWLRLVKFNSENFDLHGFY